MTSDVPHPQLDSASDIELGGAAATSMLRKTDIKIKIYYISYKKKAD